MIHDLVGFINRTFESLVDACDVGFINRDDEMVITIMMVIMTATMQ